MHRVRPCARRGARPHRAVAELPKLAVANRVDLAVCGVFHHKHARVAAGSNVRASQVLRQPADLRISASCHARAASALVLVCEAGRAGCRSPPTQILVSVRRWGAPRAPWPAWSAQWCDRRSCLGRAGTSGSSQRRGPRLPGCERACGGCRTQHRRRRRLPGQARAQTGGAWRYRRPWCLGQPGQRRCRWPSGRPRGPVAPAPDESSRSGDVSSVVGRLSEDPPAAAGRLPCPCPSMRSSGHRPRSA